MRPFAKEITHLVVFGAKVGPSTRESADTCSGNRRPMLLAEHAGVALGLAEVDIPLAPRYRAEAELARAAGADEAQIERWIAVGRKRAEEARQSPYT